MLSICLFTLGNLMITGPYQVNGLPLRRVNPRFVIATSTKIPLDGVDVSKYDDAFFNKTKKTKQPAKEKENVFMSQVWSYMATYCHLDHFLFELLRLAIFHLYWIS